MKKLMIVVLSSLSLSAFAAEPANQPRQWDGSQMTTMRLDHMQKTLDLTADQRSQLETIFQNEQKQQEQLRKDTQAKVDKVLTSDQQAKLKQQREGRVEKMKEHRQQRSKRGHQRQGNAASE